jgi:transcriptional regulator with GAF, ATPase, and Fis domain
MAHREASLVRAFVELADTLVADYDVIELGQKVVDEAVSLTAVDAAGIVLQDAADGLHVLTSSSEQSWLLELFQVQVDAGPCLLACRTGEQVLVEDLDVDVTRWPQFAQRAQDQGFHAVYAMPLRLRSERIGALNLLSTTTGGLSDADLRVGQALADIATIGILQERMLTRGDALHRQLQIAINTRAIIEQAKGVLAERNGIEMEEAFVRLRALSQGTSRRMTDVAEAIISGDAGTIAESFGPLP